MNIVLDTNCLLMSLSRRSKYFPDHHYDVLRQIEFPLIEVIGIDEFLRLLA